MKQLHLIILFLAAICMPATAEEFDFLGKERILDFHADIEVRTDGSLAVTETIRVEATGVSIKRGIFRDFVNDGTDGWGIPRRVKYDVTAVTFDGAPTPYSAESLGSGTRLKIGDPGKRVPPGEHTYAISYTTDHQLVLNDDYDQLYWNVTGNFWKFSIDAASATVTLPDGIAPTAANLYTGKAGSTEQKGSHALTANGATFSTNERLPSGGGLTIVVTWPPGSLQTAAYERDLLRDVNPVFLIGAGLLAASLLVSLVMWIAVGRDPAMGTIIPRFEPPEGFSPPAVRMLERMSFDDLCFSSGVIGLASKGVVSITEKDGNYQIHREKNGKAELADDEKNLLDGLLGAGDTCPLTRGNHKRVSAARTGLLNSLTAKLKKTHFKLNFPAFLPGALLAASGNILICFSASNDRAAAIISLALLLAVISALVTLLAAMKKRLRSGTTKDRLIFILYLAGFLAACVGVCFFLHAIYPPVAIAATVATGILWLGFHHLMKAPTKMGQQARAEIAGFKHYLGVAEEDRLNLENPPERTPELFEMFLPYALALGVEQKWSEKFHDILQDERPGNAEVRRRYRPGFYRGNLVGANPAMFGAALGTALTGALASSAKPPASSGRGAGASGGGGRSGGGAGGGGGGGW